jgi:hypothetical protein
MTARNRRRVAAIDIPMFIAVGERDLWPQEHTRPGRGASERASRSIRPPCAL